MRYTPKEMLAFASRDQETRFGAYIATYNNEKGFSYQPVDPDNIVIGKGVAGIYGLPDKKGRRWTDIRLPIRWLDKKTRKALRKADQENIRVFLTRFKDSFGLVAAYGKDDDVRDEAVMDCLILEFFKLAQIDTKKKLRKVIREGWEIRNKSIAVEEMCIDLVDACLDLIEEAFRNCGDEDCQDQEDNGQAEAGQGKDKEEKAPDGQEKDQ